MASKFVKQVEQIVTGSPLVIFSKTTCGYCARAKSLLDSMKVTFNAVELNQIENGAEVQNALKEITGQRTVPNIFIKGKSIGGCDDITRMHQQGKLEERLKEAGVI
ncbi:glutaredoxin [Chloropicon primus]|uniref:Glutaredoxin n=1 Tax=Chloropicon primus TaxID=1764295 RepID=A0A5B8MBG2_9CHLO|nr:glutaredoxin [Chloropicon primus]UPQ96985.1 glutaredoxin [Chloropicon primus]|mmetsp:Transcript_4455/g.13168  ORF Transcript_4455/g.13168 Transcript_4455/m.13168 type:complete len:106 (-) Transcript_4455:231-548(-)|eukprot:QDZ17768.1 glutaredoxin [Chloropicon primus]